MRQFRALCRSRKPYGTWETLYPYWALMCKHVSAALYGVGVRLDENPLLFFELRGINVDRFIDVTLANKVEEMLANEGKPSSRIMKDEDIWELFGV